MQIIRSMAVSLVIFGLCAGCGPTGAETPPTAVPLPPSGPTLEWKEEVPATTPPPASAPVGPEGS